MPAYAERLVSGFVDELRKIAAQKTAGVAPILGAAVAGGALYEWARRANKDRQMGKAMRIQSGQNY